MELVKAAMSSASPGPGWDISRDQADGGLRSQELVGVAAVMVMLADFSPQSLSLQTPPPPREQWVGRNGLSPPCFVHQSARFSNTSIFWLPDVWSQA